MIALGFGILALAVMVVIGIAWIVIVGYSPAGIDGHGDK